MRWTTVLMVAVLIGCGGGSSAVPANVAGDGFDSDGTQTTFLGNDVSTPGLVDTVSDVQKKRRPSVQRSAVDEEVEITTADGTRLFGRFLTPGGLAPFPAVLLLHQYGPEDRDHRQWLPWIGAMEQPPDAEDAGTSQEFAASETVASGDVLSDSAGDAGDGEGAVEEQEVAEDAIESSERPTAETLLSRGFAVLAIDLRNHGQSDPYLQGLALLVDPEGAPQDMKAALSWLGKQQAIDPERIAVMGTSIGANLVYLAMAQRLARSGVSISARAQSVASLFGLDDLDGVSFGPVLCIAGEDDSSGAQKKTCTELSSATEAPNPVKIIEASSDHGEAVLVNNPEIWSEILDYLEDSTSVD